MKQRAFLVSDTEAGIRLDIFLVRHLSADSRAAVQKQIEEGNVRVNGKPARPAHRLHAGDAVSAEFQEASVGIETLEPWPLPLEILYEDSSLLAINKPAGIVTHPGAGRRTETLANALVWMRPEIRQVGHPLRPGIVHRLDKDTSGLMIVARTDAAYHALTALFKNRAIEKHYRALAYGKFSKQEGKIDSPLGRDPGNRKKISTRARHSRMAITLYRVLSQFPFGALLDIKILTGRTHQIRVHLASENHPIVGDSIYGGGNWNRIADPELRTSLRTSGFFGLHAFSLDFPHPLTNVPLHLEAPLPANWIEVTTKAQSHKGSQREEK